MSKNHGRKIQCIRPLTSRILINELPGLRRTIHGILRQRSAVHFRDLERSIQLIRFSCFPFIILSGCRISRYRRSFSRSICSMIPTTCSFRVLFRWVCSQYCRYCNSSTKNFIRLKMYFGSVTQLAGFISRLAMKVWDAIFKYPGGITCLNKERRLEKTHILSYTAASASLIRASTAPKWQNVLPWILKKRRQHLKRQMHACTGKATKRPVPFPKRLRSISKEGKHQRFSEKMMQ